MEASLVRATLEKRFQKRQEANRLNWQQASVDCSRIVALLVSKYRPHRIWQWGSLLHPDQFSERSDIDLGIEGITRAEDFFALLGDAMGLTSFPLDIVQMEKIEPEFAEIIRMKGVLIYDDERRI